MTARAASLAVVLAVALALAACDREVRKLSHEPTPELQTTVGDRQGDLQPGAPGPGLKETVSTRSFDPGNAWEMAQGQRLYDWYNCAGCHGRGGGGGMGPALSDDRWFYGSEPDQIFRTIMEGRPNGMPSFKGRIPEDQAWQIVAFVRSMSGLGATNAAPSRSDSLGGLNRPENERPTSHPYVKPPEKP
ncbi:MAG TPA: c-type cytochrome [Usitatibacter sp.]|nr:c-type cytochrome [Usitatibacter sp.]